MLWVDRRISVCRTKDAAILQLVEYMAELSEQKGDALVDKIDEIAFGVSDCGVENVGGIGENPHTKPFFRAGSR